MNRLTVVVRQLIVLLVGIGSALELSAETVTLETLLGDIASRETQTRLPEPTYTVKLHSSHDPRTTSIDRPNWFANNDCSHFIRDEKVGDRIERVLLDETGPGAVVRFWVTLANADGKGMLRFYLDGEKVIEGKVLDILSGGKLCPAPLSDSVSKATPLLKRGHNLYLPIPYAKSCKVTYSCPDFYLPQKREVFYYNVETRAYPAGTSVKTFSLDQLKTCSAAIAAANAALADSVEKAMGASCRAYSMDGELESGARKVLRLEGPSAVRFVGMTLEGGNGAVPVEDLYLEGVFDGVRTVNAPIGALCGCGGVQRPVKTRYASVGEDGSLAAAWVMPFAKSCVLTLVNRGTGRVVVRQSRVAVSPYEWDSARSLHFHASWRKWENLKVSTLTGVDANFSTIRGRGVFLGVLLDVRNRTHLWWSEGDEKVYVDDEAAPQMIGTGSEDHFGYAWGLPAPFSHPFIAQPEGSGARAPGRVVNIRWRGLDSLPFDSYLRYDMEVFAPAKVNELDYGMFACWYERPSGQTR